MGAAPLVDGRQRNRDLPGARLKVNTILETFDYQGAHLLPNIFSRQLDRTRDVYFGLPSEYVLHRITLALLLFFSAGAFSLAARPERLPMQLDVDAASAAQPAEVPASQEGSFPLNNFEENCVLMNTCAFS